MSGHTPGPWGVYLNEDTNQYEVFHDEGRGFGRMLAKIVGERGKFQANARLIAAAPAMLAALVRYVELSPDCDYVDGEPDVCPGVGGPCPWCEMRAAIALARGE